MGDMWLVGAPLLCSGVRPGSGLRVAGIRVLLDLGFYLGFLALIRGGLGLTSGRPSEGGSNA